MFSCNVSTLTNLPVSETRFVVVCVTGQPFQGIFMQMRAISEYASVGSFETTLPSNTKLKKCTRDNDSVTHSNTNIKDNPTCFVWKAPDNEERVLRFV